MKVSLQKKKGIALIYVLIVIGFLASVSASIMVLTYKQVLLSSYVKDSLTSFYASESGLECGLYWDVGIPTSAFLPYDTSGNPLPDRTVRCNAQNQTISPDTGLSTITFSYPDGSQAEVSVDKRNPSYPTIQAKGYNGDPSTAQRVVERGINLTYEQNITSETTTDIKADIVLVLDSSGSICFNQTIVDGRCLNYDRLESAATAIVNNLEDYISDEEVRIAVVLFSSASPTYPSQTLISLSGNKDDIIDAMTPLPFYDGGTNMAGALILAENQFLNYSRPGVPRFTVLITDGIPGLCTNMDGSWLSNCGATYAIYPANQTVNMAEKLQNDHEVTIAVVGVGPGLGYLVKSESKNTGSVFQNEIGQEFLKNHIVSPDPRDTTKPFYIDVDNWADLPQIVKDIFTSSIFKSTAAGFSRQEL